MSELKRLFLILLFFAFVYYAEYGDADHPTLSKPKGYSAASWREQLENELKFLQSKDSFYDSPPFYVKDVEWSRVGGDGEKSNVMKCVDALKNLHARTIELQLLKEGNEKLLFGTLAKTKPLKFESPAEAKKFGVPPEEMRFRAARKKDNDDINAEQKVIGEKIKKVYRILFEEESP